MFTKAIVKIPAQTLANGVTTSGLGKPDYKTTLKQHEAYCEALIKCGMELTILEADPHYPDSCFVEDTAVVTFDFGVITRPGHKSRMGEETEIKKVLERIMPLFYINEPGKIDGGDVLQADMNFYIGLSSRTNLSGAKQMKEILSNYGYEIFSSSACNLLHFKTGVSYLGSNTILVHELLCSIDDFRSYKQIIVDNDEAYAANSLLINDTVLLPKGFPKTKANIEKLGYPIIELEMSEFQKMDGGLSCLSLRF